MNEKLIEEIVQHSRAGNKIFFGHNRSGKVKIKVKHGLLGLFTTRYRPDIETFDEVKRRLKGLREDD